MPSQHQSTWRCVVSPCPPNDMPGQGCEQREDSMTLDGSRYPDMDVGKPCHHTQHSHGHASFYLCMFAQSTSDAQEGRWYKALEWGWLYYKDSTETKIHTQLDKDEIQKPN